MKLSNAAGLAVSAWVKCREAQTVDEVRDARINLAQSERLVREAFVDEGLESSNMEFGDWVVTVEAHRLQCDGGWTLGEPLIMYRKRERAAA